MELLLSKLHITNLLPSCLIRPVPLMKHRLAFYPDALCSQSADWQLVQCSAFRTVVRHLSLRPFASLISAPALVRTISQDRSADSTSRLMSEIQPASCLTDCPCLPSSSCSLLSPLLKKKRRVTSFSASPATITHLLLLWKESRATDGILATPSYSSVCRRPVVMTALWPG